MEEKIINKAIKVAATGISKSSDDEGSSQINNLLNMIQSEQSELGIKRLILFIYRQNGRGEKLISNRARELLIQDIEWMRQGDKAPGLVKKYLNYLKWSFDAIKPLNQGQKRKLTTSKNPFDELVRVSI